MKLTLPRKYIQAVIVPLIIYALSCPLAVTAEPAKPAVPAKPAAPAPTAAQVEGQAEKTVKVLKGAQVKQDGWAKRRADLLTRQEELERELEATRRLCKKTEIYLAGQKAKLAETQRRLAEMDRIQAELEPLLDDTLARLREFVEQDLPFRREERLAAVTAVEDTLNDYDAGLAEKTRRLLGGLLTEARYGHGVTLQAGELTTSQGLLQVDMLRLGRLAMFGLSPDREQAWRILPGQKEFEPVDGHQRALAQAAEMAARRRVVALVELPVGQAPAGQQGGAK